LQQAVSEELVVHPDEHTLLFALSPESSPQHVLPAHVNPQLEQVEELESQLCHVPDEQ
jgi:hypothetical protein